jgi:signal transduction histidine kinase
VDTSDLVTRLSQHRTLGPAPRTELEWLVAHGTLRRVEVGYSPTRDEEFLHSLDILLSGHMAITVDRGLGPRKVMEWGAGDVTGFLPYSRMGKPPGDSVVDQPTEVILVHRDHFPEMIRECPTVTAILVHQMLDRARRFTSSESQDEKMTSLGRLSAQVAHELNNPASAATRSSHLLGDGITRLEDASRALGALQMAERQQAAIDRLRGTCMSAPPVLSPIDRSDREDAIADWIERRGLKPDSEVEGALVDTALTLEDLDALAAEFTGESLKTALKWLAADCGIRMLASEVELATSRIHDLVATIKRVSYMDRTSAPEPVELASSLNDSITLLKHKMRRKSVNLSVGLEPDLPRVQVIGGDLNSVWMNLIDNALDAVRDSGEVAVEAVRRQNFVVVTVTDNGSGIPEHIRERIFEPFFTTKEKGDGTGMGLDTARRLVQRNGGDIGVESRPGRTVFSVTLPVAS